MTKRALIIGISGQDGIYLAELLLEQGYEVHGASRRVSSGEHEQLTHLAGRVTLHPADLADQSSIHAVVKASNPHEIYNLAAQSFVPTSWSQPIFTADITGLGVVRVLDAIRQHDPSIKLYQASSSEIFGHPLEVPQTEITPLNPRTPYGCAKAYAHMVIKNYRDEYGLFVSSGILYNHESPRRGLEFVTRKITDGAARIKLGMAKDLHLGNLDGRRDWGHAADYVRAMWLMLQQDAADDFVIATGKRHAVRDCCAVAFGHLGLDYNEFVQVDPKFVRVADEPELVGDATKAREQLGWAPEVSFEDMIREMVEHDVARLERELSRQA